MSIDFINILIPSLALCDEKRPKGTNGGLIILKTASKMGLSVFGWDIAALQECGLMKEHDYQNGPFV